VNVAALLSILCPFASPAVRIPKTILSTPSAILKKRFAISSALVANTSPFDFMTSGTGTYGLLVRPEALLNYANGGNANSFFAMNNSSTYFPDTGTGGSWTLGDSPFASL